MLTRDDYLQLDAAEARRQWRAIVVRAPAVAGRRQVDFTPVETLLCLAASLLVNHRQYGGSTSHRAVEPVPSLARLFRRPNSSILAKMANLDGSRPNGAKHEVEIASELLASPVQLAASYRLLLAAGRDVGVEHASLPDFLGLEDNDEELYLLGQDELDQATVETVVQERAHAWASHRADLEAQVTQRLLVAATRIGQHRFASQVLRNHAYRCVFCGLKGHIGGVRARGLLVASHIKPWRVSTSTERLDARNGLTACPTHDVAFDIGLITVNGGLRIRITAGLEQQSMHDPAARAAFGRPPLAHRLLLPSDALPPGSPYLIWHQDHIYLGRGDAVQGSRPTLEGNPGPTRRRGGNAPR